MRVREIVNRFIDSSDPGIQGSINEEVKVLFSRLLKIPEQDIPDDHEEVVIFSGMSSAEMCDKLMSSLSHEQVDEYHLAMEFEDDHQAKMTSSEVMKEEEEKKKKKSLLKGFHNEVMKVKVASAPEPEPVVMVDAKEDPSSKKQSLFKDFSKKAVKVSHETAASLTIEAEAAEMAAQAAEISLREKQKKAKSLPEGAAKILMLKAVKSAQVTAQKKAEAAEALFEAAADAVKSVDVDTKSMNVVKVESHTEENFPVTMSDGGTLIKRVAPNRDKLSKIVDALDIDSDGKISIREAKEFLSNILDVAHWEIPDSHPEVVRFASLSKAGMLETLMTSTSHEVVEELYKKMFPMTSTNRWELLSKASEGQKRESRAKSLFKPKPSIPSPKHPLKESLFDPRPSLLTVRKIIEKLCVLETDNAEWKELSPRSIVNIFSKLLFISQDEISQDHSDVQLFLGLETGEAALLLTRIISKKHAAAVYQKYLGGSPPRLSEGASEVDPLLSNTSLEDTALSVRLVEGDGPRLEGSLRRVVSPGGSLFSPRADRLKLERIVKSYSAHGNITASGVRRLFSRILSVPIDEIPENDPEVIDFSSLSIEAMVDRLVVGANPESVEDYYKAVFPGQFQEGIPTQEKSLGPSSTSPSISPSPSQSSQWTCGFMLSSPPPLEATKLGSTLRERSSLDGSLTSLVPLKTTTPTRAYTNTSLVPLKTTTPTRAYTKRPSKDSKSPSLDESSTMNQMKSYSPDRGSNRDRWRGISQERTPVADDVADDENVNDEMGISWETASSPSSPVAVNLILHQGDSTMQNQVEIPGSEPILFNTNKQRDGKQQDDLKVEQGQGTYGRLLKLMGEREEKQSEALHFLGSERLGLLSSSNTLRGMSSSPQSLPREMNARSSAEARLPSRSPTRSPSESDISSNTPGSGLNALDSAYIPSATTHFRSGILLTPGSAASIDWSKWADETEVYFLVLYR